MKWVKDSVTRKSARGISSRISELSSVPLFLIVLTKGISSRAKNALYKKEARLGVVSLDRHHIVPILMIVIGFMLVVSTEKGDISVNVKKDFMEMGYLVLVCQVLIMAWNKFSSWRNYFNLPTLQGGWKVGEHIFMSVKSICWIEIRHNGLFTDCPWYYQNSVTYQRTKYVVYLFVFDNEIKNHVIITTYDT